MVVGKKTSEITFSPCFEDTDRWIHDESTNKIISEKYILTAIPIPLVTEFTLILKHCVINEIVNFPKRE